jgi:hypothetical protein
MNNIITIIELLLFALCLSLWINSLHLAFGKEMFLNWLYEWLESKFRRPKACHLDYKLVKGSVDTNFAFWVNSDSKYVMRFEYENGKHIKTTYLYKGKEIPEDYMPNAKYRNSEGLLYIAKPIYACASCMPSLWSLPLLSTLVWWKVFFICIFASVISTLISDQLYND